MRPAGLLLLAVLASCERPEPTVIDGSSQQAFERTTREARRDLPDADRLYFDRALRTVGGRSHSARDPEKFARATFDGMTGEQVVADQKAREALR
jgi:hypothetical protein